MPGTLNPSQNLIKNINLIDRKVSEETVFRPRGFYQSLVLDAFTVLSAGSVSYAYSRYLAGSGRLWTVLAAVGFFALFSAFEMLLRKQLWRRIFVLALEIVALLSFFYFLSTTLLSVVGVAAFLFLLWGDVVGHRELDNALEVRFFRATKPLLGKLITALVFMAIVLYLPQWSPEKSFFSEQTFRAFFQSVADVANRFYPEVQFNASFRDLAESIARLNLEQNADFRNLVPSARKEVLAKTTDEIAVSFGKTLGMDIEGGESPSAVFYRFLIGVLRGWQQSFGNAFMAAWAVAVFLIARGFGAIFRIIVSFIIFLVYHALLAVNVIHIVGESRMHEVVEYSRNTEHEN